MGFATNTFGGGHTRRFLPEQGPCLVNDVIIIDGASFTPRFLVHSRASTVWLFVYVALLDTGSFHVYRKKCLGEDEIFWHRVGLFVVRAECRASEPGRFHRIDAA